MRCCLWGCGEDQGALQLLLPVPFCQGVPGSVREGTATWKTVHRHSLPSHASQTCKAASLACCLRVQSPDALQSSEAILDQSESYILGNIASKRRVKLWLYFKHPERPPWNLQKELIKRQSIAPGPGHPCHSHRPVRMFWALRYARAGGVGRGGTMRVSVHHPSAHQLHLPHSLAWGCGQTSGNHRAWQPICFLVIIQDGAASGPCPQHHWVVSLWKFASVSFSHCWPQPAPKARPSNTSVT